MATITDNKTAGRYECTVNEQVIFANYHRDGATITISYVEAPLALRGTGAAGAFMQELMETLLADGVKKVIPTCGYAAAWLKRHKEYADLH